MHFCILIALQQNLVFYTLFRQSFFDMKVEVRYLLVYLASEQYQSYDYYVR